MPFRKTVRKQLALSLTQIDREPPKSILAQNLYLRRVETEMPRKPRPGVGRVFDGVLSACRNTDEWFSMILVVFIHLIEYCVSLL